MFSSTKKKGIIEKEFSNSSNIIGKGTSLDGNLNTAGNLRVEGKVGGSIHTKAKIVLGSTSMVEGNIIAQNAEIGGEVQGTIRISGLLILKSTALVNGDIIASKLVFEEGAKFNGKCSMSNTIDERTPTKAQNMFHKKNDMPIESTQQQVNQHKKGTKTDL